MSEKLKELSAILKSAVEVSITFENGDSITKRKDGRFQAYSDNQRIGGYVQTVEEAYQSLEAYRNSTDKL